jgi:hypothetical protein
LSWLGAKNPFAVKLQGIGRGFKQPSEPSRQRMQKKKCGMMEMREKEKVLQG